MLEQLGTKDGVDTARRVSKQIGAQPSQRNFEQREARERHHNDRERAYALVNEHLVDDHLKEQRRRESRDLDEQGNDQNFSEDMLEAGYDGKEPAQSESGKTPGDGIAQGKDDKPTRPSRGKLASRPLRGRTSNFLNQHSIFVTSRQDEIATIRALGDRRQRERREPRKRRGHMPRLEALASGDTQQHITIG